jgi:aspartate dehydrogenase
MTRKVLVIGFGAIGSDLVGLLSPAPGSATAVAVLLREGSLSQARVPWHCTVVSDADGIAGFAPDLVVEAAGHEAVRNLVRPCLETGLPVLLSSVGALHDKVLFAELVAAARAHGGRILLPSGALGGLDYVRAARGARDLALRYESRKPPAAWQRELEALGHDPAALAAPVTLFEGDAREAAARFPANLNVAATLALAGPGFEQVRVSVVADPAAQGNTHSVSVSSELGAFRAEIANRPSPTNPKTSWIVARALAAAVDQFFSPVQML